MAITVEDPSVQNGEGIEIAVQEVVASVAAEARRLDSGGIAIHLLALAGTGMLPRATVGIEVRLLDMAGREDHRPAMVEIGVARSETAAMLLVMVTFQESIRTVVALVDAVLVVNEADRPDIIEHVFVSPPFATLFCTFYLFSLLLWNFLYNTFKMFRFCNTSLAHCIALGILATAHGHAVAYRWSHGRTTWAGWGRGPHITPKTFLSPFSMPRPCLFRSDGKTVGLTAIQPEEMIDDMQKWLVF